MGGGLGDGGHIKREKGEGEENIFCCIIYL